MDILKLTKHGINPTSITSASQAAKIFDAIEVEEAKEFREKQAKIQLEAQRHQEDMELQQKSLELAEKSMKLAEDSNIISKQANKKSSVSNWIAIVSTLIALIALFK